MAKVVQLTKQVKAGTGGVSYPKSMNTPARRALYDNLGKNHIMALAVDTAVRGNRQDDWRGNVFKLKKVRNAIKTALQEWTVQPQPVSQESSSGAIQTESVPYNALTDAEIDRILELVKNQSEY